MRNGGWNIFRGGCFRARDSANQSLNLTPSGRRLVPRCEPLNSPLAEKIDLT
jgi:hypothetical protein